MGPHIEMITVGLLATNCWIAGDPDRREALLIDPGDEAERILEMVDRGGWHISAVLLTHAHFDHVLAAAEIVAATGAPFLVPPAEVELLRRAPEIARSWLGIDVPHPPLPDGHLDEGAEVVAGAHRWRVMNTPGHSPGSVTFIGEREAFVGDVLFAGSIGRTDLPGADHATLMESIETVLLPLDDAIRVLPGHGPETSIGREREQNPFILDLLARRPDR